MSVCVCVCVCVSVKSHLTSGASVRPENTVTYSVDNGGQNFSPKPLCFGDPVLPPIHSWPFSCGKRTCAL